MSPSLLSKLRSLVIRTAPDLEWGRNLLEYGRLRNWARRHPCDRRFASRYELYDFVIGECLADEPIDYLEFGVFSGTTMRHWTQRSTHERSRFIGFDTFTGLPEEWRRLGGVTPPGTFSADGKVPALEDPRVQFEKGLFQQTADGFLARFRRQRQLVINVDCDLYSSTLFVLTRFHSIIETGTVIIFDEFCSANHECRALHDYADAYRVPYRLIGYAGRDYEQVAIRIS